MKNLYLTLLLIYSVTTIAQVTNMDNSPYNMKNSVNNMDNSSRNMQNSPYNMDNSRYNADAKNGVYDNNGNRVGYKVLEKSGVTNIYDNNGNRIGYSPSQR
jgi:hypothetical protein